MPSSKFFGIPFGTSGDKATIPEDTQPSGAVSFTQGFGPDYERDPATDPLAKRVPRDETNELYYQITNALRFYQLFGLPEWYALDDSGNAVSYPVAARVRHTDLAWVSIAATNTAEPGTDATKWALDQAFSVSALEASLAEMLAGVSGTTLATPRRVASSVQRGAWNYGVAAGSANTLTASLTPALAAYTAGFSTKIRVTTTNTGTATLNINGLGAKPIRSLSQSDLVAGDLVAGSIVEAAYDSVSDAFVLLNLPKGLGPFAIGNIRTLTATGTYTPPAGTRALLIEGIGGGGAGGGAPAIGNAATQIGAGGGGGAGGYFQKLILAPLASYSVIIGAGGTGIAGNPGVPGGATSFGSVASASGGAAGIAAIISSSTSTSASGGAGGVGTGGDVNAAGGSGFRGATSGAPASTIGGFGGDGANSFLGGGGQAAGASATPGGAAMSPGAGGGGAINNTVGAATSAGGAGMRGVIIVTEFF